MSDSSVFPLVSVIVPVRNGERYLEDALRSVLAQDYRPFEIIVVDGHSTDRSGEIANSFPEVRFLTQPGKGLPDAYNFAIGAARGEWVALLEYDDLWTPNKLSVQVSYMLQRPELQFTMARSLLFLEPGCNMPFGYRAEWFTEGQTGAVLSTFVARKSVFERVGWFDMSFVGGGDVDWFARAKDLGMPTVYLDEILLKKRVHGDNLTLQNQANDAELLRIIKRTLDRQRAKAGAETS